jgi:hypothetical protein
VTGDGPHAKDTVACATQLTTHCNATISIARWEEDSGVDAIEVGRRELKHLLRDAGVKKHERVEHRPPLRWKLTHAMTVVDQAVLDIYVEETGSPNARVWKEPTNSGTDLFSQLAVGITL